MAIISRTISQVRKVKNDPDEEKITELAFLLQACRGNKRLCFEIYFLKFDPSGFFPFVW
jgi:hypothetical protein